MIEIIPNWHPLLVHFSIAFLVMLGGLQLCMWLNIPRGKREQLGFTISLIAGVALIAVLLTIASGWHAYNTVAHDTPSHIAMTDHKNWAFATATVSIVGILLYFISKNLRQTLVGALFVVSTVMVGITGFKGGELVYRHGLGVMSLPETSGEGHGHDHDHGNGDHHAEQDASADHHGDSKEHAHESADEHHHKDSNKEEKTEGKVHVHEDGKSHVH